MKINHLALWTRNLEAMRDFYTTYFGAKSIDLYHNKKTEFKSYFLSFDDETRLDDYDTPRYCRKNSKR